MHRRWKATKCADLEVVVKVRVRNRPAERVRKRYIKWWGNVWIQMYVAYFSCSKHKAIIPVNLHWNGYYCIIKKRSCYLESFCRITGFCMGWLKRRILLVSAVHANLPDLELWLKISSSESKLSSHPSPWTRQNLGQTCNICSMTQGHQCLTRCER